MTANSATAFAPLHMQLPPPQPQESSNQQQQQRRRHRITITGRLSAKIYTGELVTSDTTPPRAVIVKSVHIATTDANTLGVDPWREWRITKRLQALEGHPHVVELLETYANKQSVFLVMARCNGGDLLQTLLAAPYQRLPQHQALDVLLQVARGLAYLHAHGIAHRDVSLENVFVHNGTCQLGDFGLSVCADRLAHDCVGKPQYVAPEAVASQALGGRAYDPVVADIWSLGVLLFMLVTGAPLVDFASPRSAEFVALQSVGVGGVLQAWQLDGQLSPAIRDVLAQMLAVDPLQRIQSVNALLDHPSLVAAAQRADAAACEHERV